MIISVMKRNAKAVLEEWQQTLSDDFEEFASLKNKTEMKAWLNDTLTIKYEVYFSEDNVTGVADDDTITLVVDGVEYSFIYDDNAFVAVDEGPVYSITHDGADIFIISASAPFSVDSGVSVVAARDEGEEEQVIVFEETVAVRVAHTAP